MLDQGRCALDLHDRKCNAPFDDTLERRARGGVLYYGLLLTDATHPAQQTSAEPAHSSSNGGGSNKLCAFERRPSAGDRQTAVGNRGETNNQSNNKVCCVSVWQKRVLLYLGVERFRLLDAKARIARAHHLLKLWVWLLHEAVRPAAETGERRRLAIAPLGLRGRRRLRLLLLLLLAVRRTSIATRAPSAPATASTPTPSASTSPAGVLCHVLS